MAGLLQGKDGNLYGTTYYGGASDRGVIFRITPSGALTNLHSFNVTDGAFPQAGLVQASDGNFYGTTSQGGISNKGTVFRVGSTGGFTNLWSFTGGDDGAFPAAGLVQASNGSLLGTTYGKSVYGVGYGNVFEMRLSGNVTNLHSFAGSDGANPGATLVQGSDGNFYGTTFSGGTSNQGTVFRVGPDGDFRSLYSFTGNSGAFPQAGLVQGSDGSFYGTTSGGTPMDGYGTVFKITIPLNSPANQVSGFQPAGTNVVFTIPSVEGETYQLQFATDLVAGNWSNVVGVCVSNSIGAAFTVTNFGAVTGPKGFTGSRLRRRGLSKRIRLRL